MSIYVHIANTYVAWDLIRFDCYYYYYAQTAAAAALGNELLCRGPDFVVQIVHRHAVHVFVCVCVVVVVGHRLDPVRWEERVERENVGGWVESERGSRARHRKLVDGQIYT